MATILGSKKEKGMEALGKLPKGEAKAAQSGKEAILEILAGLLTTATSWLS